MTDLATARVADLRSYVDLDPEMVGSSSASPIKREMNNNDALYARLRNLNFGDIGPLLNQLARGMKDGYEERHNAHTYRTPQYSN